MLIGYASPAYENCHSSQVQTQTVRTHILQTIGHSGRVHHTGFLPVIVAAPAQNTFIALYRLKGGFVRPIFNLSG